jgi:hypothetical protein
MYGKFETKKGKAIPGFALVKQEAATGPVDRLIPK